MSRMGVATLRTVDRRYEADGAGETTPCQAPGCAKTTSGGKPFCFDHLEHLSYVRKVQRELERRDEDAQRLRRIDADGPLCREIRVQLRQRGPRTFEGLARELGVAVPSLEAHVHALAAVGLARALEVKLERGETKRVVALPQGELRRAV